MLGRAKKQTTYTVQMMGSGLRPPEESKGFSNAWAIQYILFADPAPPEPMRKRDSMLNSAETVPSGAIAWLSRGVRNFLLWLLG